MLAVTILLTIFVFLFIAKLKFWDLMSLLPTHQIPGIPGMTQGLGEKFFFGETQRFLAVQQMETTFPEAYKKGMLAFDLLLEPHVLIMEDRLIVESLQRHDDFPKRTIAVTEFLFGNSLMITEGDTWKHHHNMLHSCFGQMKFNDIVISSFQNLSSLIRGISGSSQSVINLQYHLSNTVFGIMGLFAFGADFENYGTVKKFYDRYLTVLNYLAIPTIPAHLFQIRPEKLTLLPYHKQAIKNRLELFDFMQRLIDDRRSKLAKMEPEERDGFKDVLSRMILKAEHNGYSDLEIKEDLFTIFFAGHDTSAASVSFLIYHLSKDLARQSCIREEIRTKLVHIGDLENVTVKDVQFHMPLLTAAIHETWRLTPPASGAIGRIVTNPNGVQLGGVHLPCGTTIFPSMYSSHRDVKLWGSDVDTFRPDRFLMNTEDGPQINKEETAKLLTFGVGKHSCPGKLFATQQVMLGSILLLNQFEFILPEDSPHKQFVHTRPSLTIMCPDRLDVIVKSAL